MEGVVDQPEGVQPLDRRDRVGRLALGTQRADFEPERLDPGLVAGDAATDWPRN